MCIPLVFVFHFRPLFLPILHTSAENMPAIINYPTLYTATHMRCTFIVLCVCMTVSCVMHPYSPPIGYLKHLPQAMYCKHLPHTSRNWCNWQPPPHSPEAARAPYHFADCNRITRFLRVIRLRYTSLTPLTPPGWLQPWLSSC